MITVGTNVTFYLNTVAKVRGDKTLGIVTGVYTRESDNTVWVAIDTAESKGKISRRIDFVEEV